MDILMLYISYFIFFSSAFLMNRNSSMVLYTTNVILILILGAYLLVNITRINNYPSIGNIILIGVTLPILLIAGAFRSDIYTIILFLKILIFVTFFRMAKISSADFCRFVNITYLIYVLVSVLFFYNLMPFSLYERWEHPTMYADIGPLHYYVFLGMEGSASYIDSYSGTVLILNIFFCKLPSRKFYIFLSSFFTLYTLRMTPLAALLFCFVGYFFIRRKITALAFLLSINLLFGIIVYWLVNEIDPLNLSVPFVDLMYGATHGRSMIWQQQIDIMFKEYTSLNYIAGGYDVKRFSIPALQIWGQETGDFYDNPHNTYLMLLFRSPILFVIYYLSLLYLIFRKFERKEFVLMLFILIVCYTNSSIISIQNPIYLFTLLFLLLNQFRKQSNEDIMLASGV